MYPLHLSFRAHIVTHSPSDPPFHILAPTKPHSLMHLKVTLLALVVFKPFDI